MIRRVIVERIEHDPAVTIDRLEAEDFVVHRLDDGGGYRVAGTMAGEPVVFLVPDADALYYLWLGWWTGSHHERDRASYRGYTAYTPRPASSRRRDRARSDSSAQLLLFE